MNIISIDPSLSSTGVDVLFVGGNITFSIKPNKTLDFPGKLMYIYNEIRKVGTLTQYDLGIVEGFSFKSKGNAIYKMGAIGGVVRLVLAQCCNKVIELPTASWKAATMPTDFRKLKKGTKKKDAAYCAYINSEHKTDFTVTDEADAYLMRKAVEFALSSPYGGQYKTIRELLKC